MHQPGPAFEGDRTMTPHDPNNGPGQAAALSAKGLGKSFGGFHAVKGVDLSIRAGTIHGLIGPNGAGKTTVFNMLTKFLRPSTGKIYLRGQDITALAPAEIARLGVVRSFQISAVFRCFTALENVRFALQRPAGMANRFWQSRSALSELDARARELLDQVDLTSYRDVRADALPYGRKRALELATTLALDPDILLLDEPMAGMSHGDIRPIAEVIRRFAKGRTVVMVEHNLPVVSDLCDVVTVLERGQVLAEGSYAEVSRNPRVREAYMGNAHG